MVKGIYFVEKVNREETISGSTPEAISMRRTKLQKKKKKNCTPGYCNPFLLCRLVKSSKMALVVCVCASVILLSAHRPAILSRVHR